MDTSERMIYEEAQARRCLATFAETLQESKKHYVDKVRELRTQLLKLPTWRLIKRYETARQLEQAMEAHRLLDGALSDAQLYDHEIGARERFWLIDQLKDWAGWLETVSDGKELILVGKTRPIMEAIAYLKGVR